MTGRGEADRVPRRLHRTGTWKRWIPAASLFQLLGAVHAGCAQVARRFGAVWHVPIRQSDCLEVLKSSAPVPARPWTRRQSTWRVALPDRRHGAGLSVPTLHLQSPEFEETATLRTKNTKKNAFVPTGLRTRRGGVKGRWHAGDRITRAHFAKITAAPTLDRVRCR